MLEIVGASVFFVIAVIIVIKSADIFVDNVLTVGRALGVSELILGVTAVAMGTSFPEYGSALIASITHPDPMGIGIVIGSNIWNLAGILGIAATITGYIESDKKFVNRDGIMAIFTSFLLFFIMIAIYFTGEGLVSKIGAIIMFGVFVIYLRILIRDQRKDTEKLESVKEETAKNKEPIEKIDGKIHELEEAMEEKKRPLNKKHILYVLVGLVGIVIGCRLLVDNAVVLAELFNISPVIISLFLIGITTSFPELVVTVTSAMKGLHDMAIGNIIGTATFNILIGVGVPAFVVTMPVDAVSIYFDAPFMIGLYILALFIIKYGGMRLTRITGIFFISLYIVYMLLRLFVFTG